MVRFVFITSLLMAAASATTDPVGSTLARRQIGVSAVTSAYQNLQNHFQSASTHFGQNGFSMSSARQEIQSLSTEFRSALNMFNSCAACITGPHLGTFGPVFMNTLSSFRSLYQTSQRTFGSRALGLFGPFGGLDTVLDTSFHRMTGAGGQLNVFVPGGFSSFFNQIHFSHSASYLGQFGL